MIELTVRSWVLRVKDWFRDDIERRNDNFLLVYFAGFCYPLQLKTKEAVEKTVIKKV